jgi:hypothetical protein
MNRRSHSVTCAIAFLAAPGLMLAGDVQENGGWRRVDQTPPQRTTSYELTILPGALISARLNQTLSSELNEPGDAFSATLTQPVVVDGIVVANRGQTVAGRVVDSQRAGRVKGVSRLGLELTELTLADGRQIPIQTRLVEARAPTSGGRDAAAIAGTTALGATIGAIAEGGVGAGIGAAAGAAAGGIGVLLTRGQPTVLHPESVLTFRNEHAVAVSTERAPLAFRQVTAEDYDRGYPPEPRVRARCYDYYGYDCPPYDRYDRGPRVYIYPSYPPYPPYVYPYYPYYWGPRFYRPYFWGPKFYGFWGPRFYGPGFSFYGAFGW